MPVPAPRSLPVVSAAVPPTATYAMAQQAPVPLAVPQARVLAASTPLGVSSHLARKVRRLYVGNLPIHPGVTEQALLELFNALYLAAFGIVTLPQTGVDAVPAPSTTPPVSSVWLHAEGKFSFIEMRTEQDAVNLIGLSGVSLHGRPLRINRPSDYHAAATGIVPPQPMPVDFVSLGRLCSQLGGIVQPPAQHVAAQQVQPAAAASVHVAPSGYPTSAVSVPPPPPAAAVSLPLAPPMAPPMHAATPVHAPIDSAPAAPAAPQGASPSSLTVPLVAAAADGAGGAANLANSGAVNPDVKTVVLLNMVTEEDVTGSTEDYEDLVDDIRAECSQYGEVTSVVIPRNSSEGYVKGVFVGFDRAEDASVAAGRLRGRAFDGRSIDVRFGLPGVTPESLAVAFQP